MSTSMNVFEKRINIRELEQVIGFAKRRKRSIMVFGGAGLGKSNKLQQIADVLCGFRKDNLVDVRLSDKEPSDVAGLPMPVQDPLTGKTTTVFATPSFWPTDPDWEGIILLDELTNAYPILQQAAYQIMLDHRIGDYVFPKGAIFVGAGNRDGDGGATSTLLAPLANRMVIVEVDYDAEIWISDFAIPASVHPSVVGYIKANPEKIYTYPEAEKGNSISFSTPRSLDTASQVLYDLDEGFIDERMASILVQGSLGKGLDDELLTYHIRAKELPAIRDIMDGTTKEHSLTPDKVDLLYIIGSQGTAFLRKEMKDHKLSDEEVIQHAGNFVLFLHNNYGSTNMDFVMGVFLALLQKTALGPAVLSDADFREKMVPKLVMAFPECQKIVSGYHENFASLIAEAEAKKN